MTIVSTAETTTLETQQPDTGIPPLNDTIVWFQNVDWVEVRERCRGGVNNCGLVIAVIGEKLHDFGCFLANV